MSEIQVLDPKTALKIAAGEVIDRPASVVRELIDNSLDAEASWIEINVEQGGKSFLSVHDNGLGMDEKNIQKSWLNHATSKIRDFDDLNKLMSFGFRGEALASIAEIAKLSIASCRAESYFGNELVVRFGAEESFEPKGMNQGTAITVTEFFENVPARLKFLGTDTSEYRAIVQEFLKKSLARPDVAFTLIHNGEKKYQLNQASELMDRIQTIFPDLKGLLRPFIYEEQGIKVYGFLSDPSWYKSSRAYQYLFVNGRAIEWKSFTQQISVAYNNLIPPAKFPAVFCYMEMDTEKIDFNVHPQKKEIRFENERLASDVVRRAMRLGIEHSQIMGIPQSVSAEISLAQDKSQYIATRPSNSTNYHAKPISGLRSGQNFSSPSKFKQTTLPSINMQENLQHLFQQSTEQEKPYQILKKASYKGVIFQTFLLWEYQDVLYVVDFHALHERIRYEKLLNYHQSQIPSQQILPITLNIPSHDGERIEQMNSKFEQLGFSLSLLSHDTLQISSVPSVLSVSQAEIVIREILDSDLESLQDSHLWDSICKIIACKGSVRSGDRISDEEAWELVDRWAECKNPDSCPHGRPIMVQLSHYFFDKQFKRTGF